MEFISGEGLWEVDAEHSEAYKEKCVYCQCGFWVLKKTENHFEATQQPFVKFKEQHICAR